MKVRRLAPLLIALAMALLSSPARADAGGVAAGASLVALGGLGLIAGAVVLATFDNGRDVAVMTTVAAGSFAAVGSVVLATSIDDKTSIGMSDGLRLRVVF